MIPIKVDIVPKAKRPGYAMVPEYITVHQTGNTNPGADARAHNSYIHNNAPNPAWHYTVDDHEAYQHLPLNENGWHAGDGVNGPGNRKSVGIEICVNIDGDLKKAEENGAWLVAKLIRELPKLKPFPECVKQHYDWNGKNCPAQIRARANGWSNFLGLVQQHLETASQEDYYIVQPGDTLYSIANRFGFGLDEIVEFNSITDPGLIVPGQKIRFPGQQEEQQKDALTSITGEPEATIGQARAWLKKKAPEWTEMAELYYSIAPRYGIRADVALAQAAKETGYFRYGGLVKPEQNNFAGIGATGQASDGNTPLNGADPGKVRFEKGVHGAIFADKATGVEAHIQHLYAYATKDALPAGVILSDPRFTLVQRGTAKYVEHLGAGENPAGVGWAYPGLDYGQSISKDYLKPLLSEKDTEEEPPCSNCKGLQDELDTLRQVLKDKDNEIKEYMEAIAKVKDILIKL